VPFRNPRGFFMIVLIGSLLGSLPYLVVWVSQISIAVQERHQMISVVCAIAKKVNADVHSDCP
jgi:hypothetical protein